MAGALSHIRVLELSRVLAGPWACQLLADLGAEVIKVERPTGGDDTRAWGPPYLRDAQGRDTTESAYYLSTNRNKKSITVDLTKPEGQEIVRQLAAKADVLIENFKVGGLGQYGLAYNHINAVNPRIIYCSITGFGQDGPYSSRAGYDFLVQGMGGLMSITGERDDQPGGGPQKVGVALTDILTGMYAAVGVLAALASRDVTGVGQHIDLALLDVQVACLANQNMNYLISGRSPQRLGNAHPNIVPYQAFPTADGNMILAVGNDSQFTAFCKVVGNAQWADDERFRTNDARVRFRDTLAGMIRDVLRTRPTEEWIDALEAVGVPCGPINNIEQVFQDTQVKHRGMRFEMPHPLSGWVPMVANPLRLSATPVQYDDPPPLLGQHTAEVLKSWLRRSDEEIQSLRDMKIL